MNIQTQLLSFLFINRQTDKQQSQQYPAKESLEITDTGFFTGQMPFLSPNQQRQSSEGNTQNIDPDTGKNHPMAPPSVDPLNDY